MPDPFDPITLTIAKAQAADRAAQDLEEERTERTEQRQQRRHLKPTPREVTAAITAGRQQAREARLFANDWYQALLAWETREVKLGGSFHYEDHDTPPDLLLVGSNRPLPTVYLMTPAGEFDEANVGRLITEMARQGTVETQQLGQMLDRLRHQPENCMASLLREDNRWERNRERAVRYAVAVLTLAVALRVQEAEAPLRAMQRELAGLVR